LKEISIKYFINLKERSLWDIHENKNAGKRWGAITGIQSTQFN